VIIQELMHGLVIQSQERSRAKNLTLVLNIAPEIVAVADTGLEIPNNLQNCVFETFERETISGRSGGGALDLELVGRLVQLHDGQVKVEPRVEIGITASCWIRDRLADTQHTMVADMA
ncbi:MAG: ATP-binding protein, partial [Alphaproteobacteria bacterium]|nr:ATP-binding protein [Alphaproteobacteria bacterium]